MTCAFFDRGAVVDRNVKFRSNELEVVVEANSCDQRLVIRRDEQRQRLGQSLRLNLLG
jgi:hypothetical protein